MASYKLILRSLLGNSGPVKRNLFGPVDREQLQLQYQDALRKDQEDASRRWGFDFLSEKPLDGGDFQWESISATKVPLLYRSCVVGQGHLKRQRVVEVAENSCSQSQMENILCAQRCVFNHQNLEKTPKKEKDENGKLMGKQTNITDFYPTKRRGRKLKRKQTNITDFYPAKRRGLENRVHTMNGSKINVKTGRTSPTQYTSSFL